MSYTFAPSSLRLVRGTTWVDHLQLVDDAGAPVSLVGVADIIMRIREFVDSADVILELSMNATGSEDRIAVEDAVLGKIAILVDAADTLLFPRNGDRKAKYVYDALIDRGGSPQVIEPAYKGKLSVLPQVTRLLN